MRVIINAFILYFNAYLILADNSFGKLFISGDPPSPPAPPSPIVVECFRLVKDKMESCKTDAINHWNITKDSPVKNICCADWELIDCDLSAVQAKCTDEEITQVKKYADDVVDYLNETTCTQYPKGTAQCTLEMLLFTEELIDDRPPLPKPTVVDCFDQFSRNVKRTCAIEAGIKWNISRKAHVRPPIRNVCCATWDDIDCLDEVVRIRCPSIEVTDTEAFFKQIEDWAAKGACNQSTYHSQNCSQAYFREEVPLPQIIPENRRFPIQDNSPYIPIPQVDDERGFSKQEQTYFYFAFNYVMSAFPHLLYMMIILAIILITIVVIQCVIITRQVKQDRMITDYIPQFQGYRKV